MEFFELGIERIHKLIADCFSLAIQRGIIFGIIALLLGIIVVLISNKYHLFRRNNRAIALVAGTYTYYIPLVLLLGGFAIGASMATRDFFKKETKTSISPLMKLIFPTYQSHVNTHWDRVIQTRMTFTQTVDEYADEIKFIPRNENFKEKLFTYTANFMVPKITRWGIESVVGTARDIALKQSEEQGYIETSKVKALLIAHSMSMFNYPPGLWDETNIRLENKMIYFFEGIAGNIILILLFLLLIPCSETLVYRLLINKKEKSVLTAPENITSAAGRYDIMEEIEKVSAEKTVRTTVDIEIPKVFEN